MDYVSTVILILMGVIGWCCCLRKNKQLRRMIIKKKKVNLKEKIMMKGEIPKGNLGWPLIGETLDFIACGYSSRPVSFMDKRKSLYGKVFKSHLLGIPIIVSTDSDVNKVVLQNNGSIFVPYYPKSITELLGESSILRMNGGLQRRVHGLIGSFLKSPQLKVRITKEIEQCVGVFMESWTDRSKNPIYIQDETRNIAFQVLVRVLMGVGPGEELEFLKSEFGEFIKGLICVPIKLPGTRLYKSLKAKERLLKMVRRIIEEKKQKMEKSDESGPAALDAVDVLLGDADDHSSDHHEIQRLPIDFISGNIVEMMIPGEDSVPMLMTLAVKFLTDCPLALTHLLEENMELKRKKVSLGEDYAWADYMALAFTQNVISETLRMANIINAVWRKALKDVEIKGHLIPEGWCVLASFSAVHMDEENYENPYQFDPWRWQNNKGGVGRTVNSNCSMFTPFGGGQRQCPGMELARLEVSIFLHHFVTRFRWEAEEDYVVNFPTVKMKRKLPVTITDLSQLV